LALAGLSLLGCGAGGPTTHPVKGKVVLAEGDVKQLAGCTVEAMLTEDPNVRASGSVAEDGTFTLETVQDGRIVKGAREGKYQVRILRSSDDDGRGKSRLPLDPRFGKFETSGLTLQVPPGGEVILNVTAR
jgi:hypothetical protein